MLESWIIKNANDVQVALFFALLAVFAIAEIFAPAREGRSNRWKRWPVNFALTTINIVVMGMLPVTFFSAANWAAQHGVGVFNMIGMRFATLIIATLLVRGFISFSTHYLMHKVPFLWRVHRVHHLDTEFDVSTTVRFHPAEFGIAMVLGVPVVLAFGLLPWVLLMYEIIDAGVTVFSHANVRLPAAVERVLRYIIVTPDLHRVHHSAWQPETDSNVGAVFPIWDIVFGTFRTETRAPQEEMMIGLGEVRDARAQRITWLLSSPFRRLAASPAFDSIERREA